MLPLDNFLREGRMLVKGNFCFLCPTFGHQGLLFKIMLKRKPTTQLHYKKSVLYTAYSIHFSLKKESSIKCEKPTKKSYTFARDELNNT